MASKTADNAISLTNSPTTVYDPATSGDASTCYVSNRSGSSGNVLVNVANLHAATDFAGLAPGATMCFKGPSGRLGKVVIKSDSTATADFGLISRI
jgi:hypothetical protein